MDQWLRTTRSHLSTRTPRTGRSTHFCLTQSACHKCRRLNSVLQLRGRVTDYMLSDPDLTDLADRLGALRTACEAEGGDPNGQVRGWLQLYRPSALPYRPLCGAWTKPNGCPWQSWCRPRWTRGQTQQEAPGSSLRSGSHRHHRSGAGARSIHYRSGYRRPTCFRRTRLRRPQASRPTHR